MAGNSEKRNNCLRCTWSCYGLGANSAVLAHMPQAITLIFGGSGIVPAALFAIILNIVLPPDEKSEVEIAEEILDMKKKEAQKK